MHVHTIVNVDGRRNRREIKNWLDITSNFDTKTQKYTIEFHFYVPQDIQIQLGKQNTLNMQSF